MEEKRKMDGSCAAAGDGRGDRSCWYILYIRQQFYDESTRNLLETYEQVDKSFTIFSRSNWNMLNEWGKSLQAANEEGLAEERLRSYEAEREIWRYSSVYLFNENCEYRSIRGT